tara:strand:+ start:51 stop:350 length:300 start_codon:yes stop_codon:yes gene_type:complete
MKIVKIPKDIDPQEIKDKIILLEKQLRQYIRILGLVIATVILETVLVLFSIVNFDFLSVWFLVFLLFISWKTWKKINSIVTSLAIHRLLDNLNDKDKKQ